MGLNPQQLRDLVIRPTLKRLGLWSTAAEELVLGTGIQESGLQYLQQLGAGLGCPNRAVAVDRFLDRILWNHRSCV